VKETTSKTQTRMDRNERYPSLGHCIYCGTLAAETTLTEEHIIPKAIGGRLIFDGASCKACQDQTHAFEGHALDLYRPIRRQLGFPESLSGRKALERRQKEKFTLELDGRRVKVASAEFPALMLTIDFPPPSILTGGDPQDLPLSGGIHAVELAPEFGERLNAIRRKYRANKVSIVGVDKSARIDEGDLGRMLAKIAHGFAIAVADEPFVPLLTHIIRGQKPYYLPYYVGCQMTTQDPPEDLHEVSIASGGFGNGKYVVVRVRLFATFNTPAYLVVAGIKGPTAETVPYPLGAGPMCR
jgi:HNH endonuclease